jgi:hypothetical protein
LCLTAIFIYKLKIIVYLLCYFPYTNTLCVSQKSKFNNQNLNKIFKYRPLSEFLFKELFYQELYFASYEELNDPLDLSARIEFTSKDKESIEYLIWFILKTQFDYDEFQRTNENIKKLIKFNKDKSVQNLLIEEICKRVNNFLKKKENIWTWNIINIINDSIEKTEIDIVFDSHKFREELERITSKFLKNSYVSCFSKTNNEFLMWSHYASKHSGICLEFSLDNSSFPFEYYHRSFEYNNVKNKKRILQWESNTEIRLSGNLNEVRYVDEQPYINFYQFAPIFENEDDIDMINFHKLSAFECAMDLEWVFSTKIKNWKYENEYRLIDINFDKPKIPEERIKTYPKEILSAVYFGINTPKNKE